MTIGINLFIIGMLGFIYASRNIILLLLSLELMIIGITYIILITSGSINDIVGELFSIYMIILAGIESAVGLAIIISFYKLRGNIEIEV
jgi:NADH-ubiquinone oxidoreductase chain 4L